MSKCTGLFGKLFGHKYTKMDYSGAFDFCLRCGAAHE